jgi:nitroreductase
MDVLEAILTRRSIRKFIAGKIADEDLQRILKAGMYAPSAHNYQPWQFIVIRDTAILQKIRKVHPYAEMLKTADLAIVVCGDLRREEHTGYLVQACAAATQNILLAAHGQGLGGVWLGVYPRENRIKKISKLLHLPKEIIPVSMVALGLPGEKKEIKERFKQNKVHTNGWRETIPE